MRLAPAPAPNSVTKRCSTASARSSTRAASSSPAPPRTRASSASSRSTTCARSATPASSSRSTAKAPRSSAKPSLRDVSEVPAGHADLVFVCTPAGANVALLRACAKLGVRAAFVASAGYREAGPEGRALEDELVATADELGIVMAGPNGQGVISTPVSMCAQIVAPYPPPGAISVVSQSGNLVSSFLNYAVQTGVGIAKAISSGNSAQTRHRGLSRVLRGRSRHQGRRSPTSRACRTAATCAAAIRRLTARKPLVLVKGGVASEGQRAALSHTGSLATDDRVFDGICRQLGVAARAERGSGLRVGGDARDAAAAARPARDRVHHGRRLGRARRRRVRRRRGSTLVPLPERREARRSTAWSRLAGAATTRSTSPAAKPATRCRPCSTCSARTPTSTP